jgi:hypothetical protein
MQETASPYDGCVGAAASSLPVRSLLSHQGHRTNAVRPSSGETCPSTLHRGASDDLSPQNGQDIYTSEYPEGD